MSEREREQMLYGLSAFFVGEERLTSQFSGLVMAAEDKQRRPSCSDSYFRLFDGFVVQDHAKLLADPSSAEAKLDFVTTQHMVIEGTLALTGQHFQTMRLERRGILPGRLDAFKRIAQDEHRHVAYGAWYLQSKATDPQLAKRVQGQARADAAGGGGRDRSAGARRRRRGRVRGREPAGAKRVRIPCPLPALEGDRQRAARDGA